MIRVPPQHMNYGASPEAPHARCSLDAQLAQPVLVVELELAEELREEPIALSGLVSLPLAGD
jgi:hypothetical protein